MNFWNFNMEKAKDSPSISKNSKFQITIFVNFATAYIMITLRSIPSFAREKEKNNLNFIVPTLIDIQKNA